MNLTRINELSESILKLVEKHYTNITSEEQLLLCGWCGLMYLRTRIPQNTAEAHAIKLISSVTYEALLDDEELAVFRADVARKRLAKKQEATKNGILSQEKTDGD